MKHRCKKKGIQFSKAIIVSILLVLTQVLGACNYPFYTQEPLRIQMSSAECDELLETSSRRITSTQLASPEQLVQIIAAMYDIAPDKVAVYDEAAQESAKSHITKAVRWEDSQHYYGIDIATDQLVSFQIGYRKQEPTVNDILLCLGAPESYLAWYGLGTGEAGMGLLLKLFYPQQGVIVTTNVNTTFTNASELTAPIPTDVARLPVNGLRFSQPKTTSVELLQEYLSIDLSTLLSGNQRSGSSYRGTMCIDSLG